MRTKVLSVILLFFCLQRATAFGQNGRVKPCVSKDFKTNALLRVDFTFEAQPANFPTPNVAFANVGYELSSQCNELMMDTMFLGEYRLLLSKPDGTVMYAKGFSSVYDEWALLDSAKRGTYKPEHSLLMPQPSSKNFYITIQQRTKNGDFETIAETRVKKPKKLPASKAPASFLMVSPDENSQLNLVIVSDNYSKEEMLEFLTDANTMMQRLFSTPPFASYQQYFNVMLVENPTTEHNPSNVETNFLGMDRYVTIRSRWALENLLTGIPHLFTIVLHKSDEYLGAGVFNQYCVVPSGHPEATNLLRHELGHYMFGLADEYVDEASPFVKFYDRTEEPWEINITKNAEQPKWGAMRSVKQAQELEEPIDDTTLPQQYELLKGGVFQGAGYQSQGIYRPYKTCAMRSIRQEFCPVCDQQLVHQLDLWSGRSQE